MNKHIVIALAVVGVFFIAVKAGTALTERRSKYMSDNWVVQHLINTLNNWNDKLAEVWKLLTMSPESFKGGGIWRVILTINGSLQAIGLALLVLFFLSGVVKTSANLGEIKRPEHALKLFMRFAIAKV